MWQRPQRPNHAVTQPFNSGMVSVWRVTDGAAAGAKPAPELHRKAVLPYDERRMGIGRYYDALQALSRADRVIRVQDPGETGEDGDTVRAPINSQDVAVTEDGRQYAIELVQTVPDVWPKSLDLTLRAVLPVYELPEVSGA